MPPEALPNGIVPPQTRDGFPVRQGPNVDARAGRTPTSPMAAAGPTSRNTPFREYKHWVHEGGISTPLIAHWPAGIAAKGELRRQPGHLIDIMATCVDVAGVEYPDKVAGQSITPLEGKSLVPALAGRQIERDAIYWEHEGNRAVRSGDWKLVAKGPGGAWELYDFRTTAPNRTTSRRSTPRRCKSWSPSGRPGPFGPTCCRGSGSRPTSRANEALGNNGRPMAILRPGTPNSELLPV